MAKILVVDDDDDLLESLKLLLSIHGFSVLALNSADGIIENLINYKPNLILLDILIGDIDGRIVCQKIKTETQYRNVPVILYSSCTDLLTAYKLYRADACIEKPFDNYHLVSTINSFQNSYLRLA